MYIQQVDSADVNIVFEGENKFYVPQNEWVFCINFQGNLHLSGSGSVELVNDFYNPDDPYGNYGYPCIQTEGDLTIDGVKIAATSRDGTNPIYCIGDMEIKNGAEIVSNAGSYPALYSAGNMTIIDSDVTANADGSGIWCDSTLTIDGDSRVETNTEWQYYSGIGAGAGIKIGGSTEIIANSSYGLFNNGSGDIEISDDANVKIDGDYGVYNVTGGKFIVSGGVVEINGAAYAIVGKADLSNYPDPAIYAGTSKAGAKRVKESSDYNKAHYVKICPASENVPSGASGIPETGDGFGLGMWIGALMLSAAMMALMLKKRYN